jgi:SAM-dependent methyltransferase
MNQVSNFELYSRYYDAFYDDKSYAEESACVSKLIRKFRPSAQTILELGCGTGNHAEFLGKEGFQIKGLERSEEMVSLARAKTIANFEPVVSDIRKFDLKRRFDVAISLFHVISYLTTNDDLISCFRSVNAHLEIEGVFIFDAWYSPAIFNLLPETRIKRKTSGNLELTRLAEPTSYTDRNTVEVNYEIIIRNTDTGDTQIIREQHTMRHFSIPEIELLAEFTGFEIVTVQDLLSGNKPSIDSWATCFVLKKNRESRHTC